MLKLESIIGAATDPPIADRLHHPGCHGRIEYLSLTSEDAQRHRMRASTDTAKEMKP
jgi:urease accessory protein